MKKILFGFKMDDSGIIDGCVGRVCATIIQIFGTVISRFYMLWIWHQTRLSSVEAVTWELYGSGIQVPIPLSRPRRTQIFSICAFWVLPLCSVFGRHGVWSVFQSWASSRDCSSDLGSRLLKRMLWHILWLGSLIPQLRERLSFNEKLEQIFVLFLWPREVWNGISPPPIA